MTASTPSPRLRRRVGLFLERLAGNLSLLILRCLQSFSAPQAAALPAKTRKVVFIGAHPDDESASAGATLAQHGRAGDVVHLVVITDGGASRAGGLGPAEMAARRKVELAAATKALGVTALSHLQLPERVWNLDVAANQIRSLVADADLVYTHGPVDYHPDHLKAARLVAGLVRPGQCVRVIQGQTLLTPLLSNCTVRVEATDISAQATALAAHVTQANTLEVFYRVRAFMCGLYSEPAEAFWEMDGAAFQRIVDASPWLTSTDSPFRAMRHRGFSDPLAVCFGFSARLRLKRLANPIETP